MQKNSIPTKAAAIADYCSGNGDIFTIAKRYNISEATLINWVKNAKETLKPKCLYGNIPLRSTIYEYTGLIERKEMKERKFKTKDAEIKFLRDKVAYLETLSELMGYNPDETPKKKDLKSSSKSLQKKEEETSPDCVK